MKLDIDLNKLTIEELEAVLKLAKKHQGQESDEEETATQEEIKKPKRPYKTRKTIDLDKTVIEACKIIRKSKEPLKIISLLDKLGVPASGQTAQAIREKLKEQYGIRVFTVGGGDKRKLYEFCSARVYDALRKQGAKGTMLRKSSWFETLHKKLGYYKRQGLSHKEAILACSADRKQAHPSQHKVGNGNVPLPVPNTVDEAGKSVYEGFLKDSIAHVENDWSNLVMPLQMSKEDFVDTKAFILTHQVGICSYFRTSGTFKSKHNMLEFNKGG